MSISKCISKFLTGFLLISTGIHFFGCSTSYMMDKTKKPDKKTIDNLIEVLDMIKKRRSLAHEILSGSSSDEEQQDSDKSFLNKKRHMSRSDESKYFFDDEITFKLRGALAVRPTNRYLLGLKTNYKQKYAYNLFNLNMLRIARLIYTLENLNDHESLVKYPEVCKSLDKIKSIKDEAIKNHKVTNKQLLDFITIFSTILDKINFDEPKCQLTLNGIKTSLRLYKKPYKVYENLFKDGRIQAGIFGMFKTLEYCERTHTLFPEILNTDSVDIYKSKIKFN